MGGFWTDIPKCSEGEGGQFFFFFFFFIGTSATKRFARSRIFRYGLPQDILNKRQRIKELSVIRWKVLKIVKPWYIKINIQITVFPASLVYVSKYTPYVKMGQTPWTLRSTLLLRITGTDNTIYSWLPVYRHAYMPRLSAPPIGSAPVEDGGHGAPHKVSAYALVAVDEEPRVLRTSSFPANVERSNALTAVEVVSLWASLAVPPNHRVDRCAKEVGCGPAQVKESRLCACCW